jgi:hypothetical protein
LTASISSIAIAWFLLLSLEELKAKTRGSPPAGLCNFSGLIFSSSPLLFDVDAVEEVAELAFECSEMAEADCVRSWTPATLLLLLVELELDCCCPLATTTSAILMAGGSGLKIVEN